MKVKYQKEKSPLPLLFCGGCRKGCPGWQAYGLIRDIVDAIIELSGQQQGGAGDDLKARRVISDVAASLGYEVKIRRRDE